MTATATSPTVPPVTRVLPMTETTASPTSPDEVDDPKMETTALLTSPADVDDPKMETTASACSPAARVLSWKKLTRSLSEWRRPCVPARMPCSRLPLFSFADGVAGPEQSVSACSAVLFLAAAASPAAALSPAGFSPSAVASGAAGFFASAGLSTGADFSAGAGAAGGGSCARSAGETASARASQRAKRVRGGLVFIGEVGGRLWG